MVIFHSSRSLRVGQISDVDSFFRAARSGGRLPLFVTL